MTPYQIEKLAKKYRELFELGTQAIKHPDDELASQPGIFQHCFWMCIEIEKLIKQGQFEKAMCGLHFIQGCLWCYQVYTIKELKDHNR
jgi:hypothetical protein